MGQQEDSCTGELRGESFQERELGAKVNCWAMGQLKETYQNK